MTQKQKKTIKEEIEDKIDDFWWEGYALKIATNKYGEAQEYRKKKVKEIATKILSLFKKELDDTFLHLMKEFANTPIDKRGTGWDWLKKARDKLIEELT